MHFDRHTARFEFLRNPIIKSDMDEIFMSRRDWGMLDGSSVFVTGGTGMIASYCVMFLLYLNAVKGVDVRVLVGARSREKAMNRFSDAVNFPFFELVEADVINRIPEAVIADYVMHAASLASPQYYALQPVEVIMPNVVGTFNVLEHARLCGCRGVLFFSTGSVYGTVSEVGPVSEEASGRIDFLDLGNMYGVSKQCGEALCKAYAVEYGVPAVSARICHSYGPTMDIENDARVFAEFARSLIHDENIVLRSDGSSMRPFCYMTDLVSGLFCVLLNGKAGESYNVGNSEQFMTISELANRLVDAFPEKSIKVVQGVRLDEGYKSSSDNLSSNICVDKLRSIGWKGPTVDVEEGFRRVVVSEMFRRHTNG